MFLDVNVPFQTVPYIHRVEMGAFFIAKIPERIVMSIVNLAKTAFNLLLALVLCGQSRMFNVAVVDSFAKMLKDIVSLALSPLALFAPINVMDWQKKVGTEIDIMIPNAMVKMNRNQEDLLRMGLALIV